MSLWPFVWAAWPGAEYAVTTSMGGPESPGEHAMTEELLTSRCDVWHVTRDVVITRHCAGSGVTRACVSPTPWGRWCTAAGGGRGRGPGLGAGASSTSWGAASPRSWGSSACGSTCSMVLSSFPWPSSSCSAFYSSTGPSQIHHHFFHIKATLVSRTLNRTCYLFSVHLQTTPVLSWWIHTMEKFIKQVKTHIKANTKLIPQLYRTLLRWPRHLHLWLWSPACGQWGARLPGDWPLVWVRALLQEERWAEELTSDQVSRGPTQTRHNRLILTQICQTNFHQNKGRRFFMRDSFLFIFPREIWPEIAAVSSIDWW